MPFTKASTLSTREDAFGSRWLGQVIAVPSGRLDKVSPYLEPTITDPVAAQSMTVWAEIYALNGSGIPTGMPLVSDSMPLSSITIKGRVNFRLSAYVPTAVAFVLRLPDGDINNFISWRYEAVSTSGASLLLSIDGGANWIADANRTFSYRAYSLILGAVDPEQQTASIQPGTIETATDATGIAFNTGILDRTVVVGDTVQLSFGKYVVTLVVDQSGSMTWNDANGLRFDFLRELVTELDAAITPLSPAEVKFSILKFRGRRIGNMKMIVEGTESGLKFDGTRILRKAGAIPPYSPTDGNVVYEGAGEWVTDYGLTPGTTYQYAAYSYANYAAGTVFSDDGRLDYAVAANPREPLGTAGLVAELILTDSGGTPLAAGTTDLGYRKVSLTWLNPAGYDNPTYGYSNITLVRRNDRFAESPDDGSLDGSLTVLLPFTTTPSTVYFPDTFDATYSPINGLTYYYSLFTKNALGVKCIAANAQATSVLATVPDRPWKMNDGGGTPPSRPAPDFTHVPTTPAYTAEAGSGEIRLQWTDTDLYAVRFKIYYRKDRFPRVIDDIGINYDGTLLYDGTDLKYTHRFLENGQPCFYVIVAFDILENASLPAEVTVAGLPPKPSATSTLTLPTIPVTSFAAETASSTTASLSWTNPAPPASSNAFWFGDTVTVSAVVEYLDSGGDNTFTTLAFVEDSRDVKEITGLTPPAATIAIIFAPLVSEGATSIKTAVSMTPILDYLNTMENASVTFHAELAVRNRETNAIVASVTTAPVTITFRNPFALTIGNDPPQLVNTRTWGALEEKDNCERLGYKEDASPGVYAGSGNPFFALIESTFRDASLGSPLSVYFQLLDPAGNPSTLIQVPQAGSSSSFTLATSDVSDEVLDDTGQPTGTLITRSLLPLTLPPSNIAGQLIILATATFKGYIRTATLGVRYEPILNIDLNLVPYQPGWKDKTEQSAFVYLAPFDAPDSQKIPVADYTVTEWAIRPLCQSPIIRDLNSEDTAVRGTNASHKSLTRGGLAQKMFWGPGAPASGEELYEVKVTANANGMIGVGYGILSLSSVSNTSINRIFLRHVYGLTGDSRGDFSNDAICSDGLHVSTWEVVAVPEDDGPANWKDLNIFDCGKAFRNAIVEMPVPGLVPDLADGQTVTLTVTGDPTIMAGVRIKTNLTTSAGVTGGTASAMIAGQKATFYITCNAKTPPPPDEIPYQEEVDNIAYKLYGIEFVQPLQYGAHLTLSAISPPITVNGSPVVFWGGGGDCRTSSPPSFIGLIEPLRSA